MTDNPTFLQALADATQRPVEVSPVREATTLGAAFLAGLATGTWGGWDDIAATWSPRTTVAPVGSFDQIGRASWRESVCQYVSISVVGASLKKSNPQTKN